MKRITFKRSHSTARKIEELFQKFLAKEIDNQSTDLTLLVDLVKIIRPYRVNKKTSVSIKPLLDFLKNNEKERVWFSEYLKTLLSNRRFSRMISDAGILQDSDFMYEVRKRLWAKLLPYQPEKDTYEYILNQVFYIHSDIIWVRSIPQEELIELFGLLEFYDIYSHTEKSSTLKELINSIGLITQRMSGRAMESAIIRMVPEYTHLESPFLALENEFRLIEEDIINGELKYITENDQATKQLRILHKQCLDFVSQAFKNSSKYGISLKVNQGLLRLRQQLQRFELLVSLIIIKKNKSEQSKIANSIQLALQLIEYNCYKYNVTGLIKESTQLISYEITQHTAKTGEHYITSSAQEYWRMFKTAMGAGIIVGFMCIFKVYAHHTETSDFGHAFLYSLNYAFGFVMIYLMGFTLATKQPAMTATTIISTIENGRKQNIETGEKHIAFAKFFAQLIRSQFIAFIGNVILAFPVALLIVWGIDYFTGENIVANEWQTMLHDASPIHSKALFHAGIAGIFLFLSGIISGNVSNSNKHNQVYYRIQEHPWLKNYLGIKKTTQFARWFENRWPGIISNIWFGVFMGTCGIIGAFLGLDLDIRHITFVSGNYALGIYGSGFTAEIGLLFWAFIGIWLVGFMNFTVSFGLSLLLAFRSRNIPFRETIDLAKSTWNYFKSFPLEFILPQKN